MCLLSTRTAHSGERAASIALAHYVVRKLTCDLPLYLLLWRKKTKLPAVICTTVCDPTSPALLFHRGTIVLSDADRAPGPSGAKGSPESLLIARDPPTWHNLTLYTITSWRQPASSVRLASSQYAPGWQHVSAQGVLNWPLVFWSRPTPPWTF